jgi:peptide deformylase
MVFINPEILRAEGEPGLPGRLPVGPGHLRRRQARREHHREGARPRRQAFELDADGLLAVCIQHEMDHLAGKVFVDYLSPLKRELVRKKLAKQRKLAGEGDVDAA